MAYGFLAKNQNSEVIISSQAKNLHYVGKADLNRTINSKDTYGGLRRWAFRIDMLEVITPIVFHTVPVAAYYGIVRMSIYSGTIWEIEIIRSGNSITVPEVYVFSELTVAHQKKFAQESYGFLVMNDTAGITYDSRFRPLLIKAGIDEVKPPNNAILDSAIPSYSPYYCSSGSSAGFTPTQSTPYNQNLSLSITKPIISYSSISQCAKQYTFTAGSDSSTYWGFWRAGVKLELNVPASGQFRITAGWVTVEYGCNYTTSNGFYYSPDGTYGGTWPLSNQSINNNNVPVMISDGALYD